MRDVTAPHFADPLADAFSVAAATAGGRVVAPDPEVEAARQQAAEELAALREEAAALFAGRGQWLM